MSNALAIAAVTETIVNLVTNHIDVAQITNPLVTTFAPDELSKLPNPGVNIFLYQVSPNAAYRNADLPTKAADGTTLLRKPQVALDLHYLFTFYGDNQQCEQQRLLGAVALAMHANPVLPRNLIQQVQAKTTFLASSNLDAQIELIRFTPIVFSLEELSKLWSFLLKVDYVLSTAYVASVVLIETDDSLPPPPLPVLSFNVGAQPFRQPVITQIVASPKATAPIIAGSDIALIGRNLTAPASAATQVLIDGVAQTPSSITPTRITLALPPGLAAGAHTAQVLQPVVLGSPPVQHAGTGIASGIAAFVLVPTIAPGATPGSFAVSVTPGHGSPPVPAIAVTVIPTAQKGQRAVLQLLSQAAPSTARLFDGGTLTADSDTLTFPIPGLPSGNYFVQVLVDGAESSLVSGAGGAPIAPTVTV